jgi:transcriptional regulator with XRE-family HTH domain
MRQMMSERLTQQEVALLIRARKILKEKGLRKDADVKGICEAAGISRKTGYQWAKGLQFYEGQDNALLQDISQLKAENEDLKERYRRVEIENEGHKLAWEIHGVDELLAAKKNTMHRGKKKKR